MRRAEANGSTAAPVIASILDLQAAQSGASGLESLGVIVMRGPAEVLGMNAAARAILSQADGLFQLGRAIVASRAADTIALATHVSDAMGRSPQPDSMSFSAISIARPSARKPYLLMIAPLPADASSERGAEPAVLVLVEDVERSGAGAAARPPGIRPPALRAVN
jgi:hypothetical protein